MGLGEQIIPFFIKHPLIYIYVPHMGVLFLSPSQLETPTHPIYVWLVCGIRTNKLTLSRTEAVCLDIRIITHPQVGTLKLIFTHLDQALLLT